jgi:ElaB/YqjD/DUF883 family membrane-anchored ribosome-binding protein
MSQSQTHETSGLQAGGQKLAQDIAAVATEAADVLHGAGKRGLGRAQDALAEARSALRDGSRDATGATRAYVQAHPMQTIGVAAAAGLVLGLLLARR